MQSALAMEKTVNQCLLDLHKVAETNGDAHVCSVHVLFSANMMQLVLCFKMYVCASAVQTNNIITQDSIAIAKKTARCAQYMGALKSFQSPHYAPGYFSRNL